MAITFVDAANQEADNASTVTVNMPAGTVAGDYVLAAVGMGATTNQDITESSGTWTEITDLFQTDTSAVNFAVFGKLMGGTPDTSVQFNTVSTARWMAQTRGYRGVDTSTPLDVTSTVAQAPSVSSPNPPAIVPASNDCMIVIMGGSSEPSGSATAPANYINAFDTPNTAGTGGPIRVVSANRLLSGGAGVSTDPGVYTVSAGTNADCWCAATVALRPAASAPTGTVAATLPNLGQSASGTSLLDVTGTTAQSLPRPAQAAGGSVIENISAAVAQTLPKLTQSASAKERFTGAVAQMLPSLLQAAAGDVTSQGASATVAQILPSLVSTIVGTVTAPAAATVTPAGGWTFPPDYGRTETAEQRRLERERLGIEPAQQRAIDRAAVKIAASYPQAGLLAPPQVIAAPAFDRLLAVVRPTEGQIHALAQAILDRLAWMAAEQEEEEAVVRLMMEMD